MRDPAKIMEKLSFKSVCLVHPQGLARLPPGLLGLVQRCVYTCGACAGRGTITESVQVLGVVHWGCTKRVQDLHTLTMGSFAIFRGAPREDQTPVGRSLTLDPGRVACRSLVSAHSDGSSIPWFHR